MAAEEVTIMTVLFSLAQSLAAQPFQKVCEDIVNLVVSVAVAATKRP